MKNKILGTTLVLLTFGVIAGYPALLAMNRDYSPDRQQHVLVEEKPKVDVVFVLDTTGSMSGLIQTAKEKIWSIAASMASAQPTPDIRIGLVGYRDIGDQYVTKIVPLSDDLDSVYAALMDFEADGGGDGPESVNKGLLDAVDGMSWSDTAKAYRAIFLVGDAPPHMDYNEMQYPEIVALANSKGIVVNTIQCGEMPLTVAPWTRIANLGQGRYFQVEQAGGAVAFSTPFDQEIAELSARLDSTRLYFGDPESKKRMLAKASATDKLHALASVESRARRAAFNTSAGGRTNQLGEQELVAAMVSGDVALADIPDEELPASLQAMPAPAREEHVQTLAVERDALNRQIQALAADRDRFLKEKVEAAGGLDDSLDHRLYDAVRDQAAKAGLEYHDGPAY